MTAEREPVPLARRVLAIASLVALSMTALAAIAVTTDAAGPDAGGRHAAAEIVAPTVARADHVAVMTARVPHRFVHLLLAFAVLAGTGLVRAGRRRRWVAPGRAARRWCSAVVEPGASRAPPFAASC